MRTVTFEIAIANDAYEEGYLEASEQAGVIAHHARQHVDNLLSDAYNVVQGPAFLPLVDSDVISLATAVFTDCDSTRLHGSCYYDLEVEVADDLADRIEAAIEVLDEA